MSLLATRVTCLVGFDFVMFGCSWLWYHHCHDLRKEEFRLPYTTWPFLERQGNILCEPGQCDIYCCPGVSLHQVISRYDTDFIMGASSCLSRNRISAVCSISVSSNDVNVNSCVSSLNPSGAILGQLGQYRGCWYLGSWRCQVISCHDFDCEIST